MADQNLIAYPLSVSNDYGLISDAKQRIINRWIRELLKDQAEKAGTLFRIEAPVGNTGFLRESFSIGRVKKNKDGVPGYHVEMGVPPIEGFDEDEAKYPLFVHEGTNGPIEATAGNVMYLRNKATGINFAKKTQVAGQQANPFMDRVQRHRNIDFGLAKYQLGLKIKKLLES